MIIQDPTTLMNRLMDHFNEKVKYHFLNPQNVGRISDADGVGSAGNLRDCGDFIELFIKASGDRITDISFLATGCPASIASASVTTEMAKDKSIYKAAMIDDLVVDKALGGLAEDKKTCSNLGVSALRGALEDYVSSGRFRGVPIVENRIAVAMSGGVDSSTAAAILRRDGYDVIGLTMRLHDSHDDYSHKNCCSPSDLADAAAVAVKIGFPHFGLNFKAIFKEKVIDNFLNAYVSGSTPNPCMECNRKLKFTALIEKANVLGASFVATGHYVRILHDDNSGRYLIKKAVDAVKDQSYMFWAAGQDVLSRFRTPLGDYIKPDIRKIAAGMGLAVATKSESQEICFIPDNDYRKFLISSNKSAPRPGPILDKAGNIVGTHRGLPFYTVGQRRGLGISNEKPLYVIKIDVDNNCLIVGEINDFDTVSLIAKESNFVLFDRLESDYEVEVKFRYNMEPVAATLRPIDDKRFLVEFREKQMGVAPGQSVVAYQGDLLVGGGVIEG